MDMINGLPDDIICNIVSFVSAKEAAFASVLSKRWRNLFTIIQNVEFDDKTVGLKDFMEGVLALPASSRIRALRLRCSDSVEAADYAHVNRCLCDVLKRGVMDLELDIDVKGGYSLPLEVFTSRTIVGLKLGVGFGIDVVPENAFLPALKTLFLDAVRFYDLCGCAFQKLISACCVLEELVIDAVDWEHWQWSRIISSSTLQRVTIKRRGYPYFAGSDFKSISFDTPSLVFLDYSDFVMGEYPTVNLGSLVVANLDFWRRRYVDITGPSDPANLIKGLGNVEIMNLLSTETTEVLYRFREAIPVFERLSRLSFKTDEMDVCWRFLPFLLKNTPNLKTLVIEGCLHYGDERPKYCVCECLSGYSFLLSSRIEVLEITFCMGESVEFVQLKHFLEKLSCLKLLKLHVVDKGDYKEKLRFARELRMLPRASSKCKIQIEYFS